MPPARIDPLEGHDAAYRQAVSRAVYVTMILVGVFENDRFQVIREYNRNGFVYDRTYLDIPRSDELIMIQVTWNDGRPLGQRKTFYTAIVDGLVKAVGIRPVDVLINPVEVKKENWSIGNGLTTYAG